VWVSSLVTALTAACSKCSEVTRFWSADNDTKRFEQSDHAPASKHINTDVRCKSVQFNFTGAFGERNIPGTTGWQMHDSAMVRTILVVATVLVHSTHTHS
jgi:hypothetical protein